MKELYLVIHTHKYGHSYAIFETLEIAEKEKLSLMLQSCIDLNIHFGDCETQVSDDLANMGEFFEVTTINLNEKISTTY